MKNTELRRKIIAFLIIALMLSSVFSGAVMVLASVNTTKNDTSTDDEAQIDTDTAHPTINDQSPTTDNVAVNASISQAQYIEADTESPIISHVSTVNITTNSTTITWGTDKPSDSLVKYGTETGKYTLFANDPAFVTEHSIEITGLIPSTTYYYVLNNTDSSGNQNESAEYDFNTLSEAEEIVDVSPPTITFVPPTSANNSIVNESEIIITITADEYLDLAILDWNGTNETMQGSGRNWSINKILSNGTYIYRVHGKDTAGNWAVSGTRTVTVVPLAPAAPFIVDLFNNITNDNSISITINKYQSIFFSATADQDIDTWHWYKAGIDQLNNCGSYTTTFNASGSYYVAVNATNANGVSNTAIFNIAVIDITILISDVSTVNITANSTSITWRTDKPSDSFVKYGTAIGNYTLFANDPSFVTEHGIKITRLLPGTTYYYVVNSTDPSGTQNESREYNFNTLSETEEIVDVSPPTITFVAPTPANNSIVNESEITINITADEYLDIAILGWNGTNETMQGSGRNWSINKILTNGTYIYRVYGNDTADNWAVSGTRTVTVVPPTKTAPFIVALFNNITNDNSISITINKYQSIFFSATADQNIDTWHWYKAGIDQLNNCGSYTTSFNASGSYSIAVNATNANGTSNTAIFNIAVTDVTILISHVSTVNITANSSAITWRTDKPSYSLVKYGTETGNYTLFANDPSFVTEHSIEITGILPNTTYYYVVNSTDSCGNQNESVEYRFNTLSEAEEIVDVSPPTITFVAPTPANNSIVNESEIIINITANEYLDIAILDWNGTNKTMHGSGRNWYIHKILSNGTYSYKVYGNDTVDNWAASETRTVTVVPPVKTAPLIIDLFNNITNDNSTSITINKSQSIFFGATADQDIDTWHWYKDGIDQLNNCSSYTTSFNASGSYYVAVNATNANGTSNTVVFNIAVTDVTILISNVSTANITANSSAITWRTDEPSDSLVKYGTETGNYTLFANDPSFVTEHRIKITGLLSSAIYYYVVNSTDSSGTQNESVEYNFNTLPETQEIVDVSPPTLTFVAPTPTNNSIVNESEIIINITADEYLDIAILDWDGTNETMHGSGRNWSINKILTNGTYIYRVYGNDTADNWAVSGTRTVTINVVPPAPTAAINTPVNNSVYNYGDVILFNDTGIDIEDGILTNSSLVWSSNRDGSIGIGCECNTSNLTAGAHIIELTVNDSSGQTDTDNVTIYANRTGFVGDTESLCFEVLDTTPPASVTNLTNTTGSSWINWTWDNPSDPDFDHTLIYLNGSWKTATAEGCYLADGLFATTVYEIATRTVDAEGNINATWVNQTAATISPGFIATAAYGTPLHKDIDVLRDFRDEYLMTNPAGRAFVKIYYNTSPPLANVIRDDEELRTAVREGLVKPLVHISRRFVG